MIGAQRQPYIKSMAQFQLFRDRLVSFAVRALQIIQKAATLANHHQQPATRTMVFLVALQMLGQMVNPLRQQRDLHVSRPGVVRVQLELFDGLRLRFHNQ